VKSVRNIPRMCAAFELSECVLTSAGWSLAARNEEKKTITHPLVNLKLQAQLFFPN